MDQEDFFGAALPLPPDAIQRAAEELGIEPEVLAAVDKKESRSKGFLSDGRPVILYEPHIFNKYTQGKYLKKYPKLATSTSRSNNYGPTGAFQYQKLQDAMKLDETAALQSCSWGRYQIMGFNYKAAGYDSVQDFVKAMCESEENHLQAFLGFIKKAGLTGALRDRDWTLFARRYNGPNYAKNNYDTDLSKFYKELTDHTIREGSMGPKVTQLQQLLNAAGAKPPLVVDGKAGKDTIGAIRDFQAKHGLAVDGFAGAATLAALAAARIEVTPVVTSKRVAGAAAGGAVGLGGSALGVADLMTKGQETATKVAQAASAVTNSSKQTAVIKTVDIVAELSRQNAFLLGIIVFLSIVLMALAGYVVWTKISDNKKLRGIAG